MKRLITASIATLLSLNLAGPVRSEPVGLSTQPVDYLGVANKLHFIGLGVYGGSGDRDISLSGYTGDVTLESEERMAYVSVYPLSWLSAYVAGGKGKYEVAGVNGSDESGLWTFGARVNLLDQLIADPWLFEDRIRISSGVSYSMAEATLRRVDAEWSDLRASLVVSLVNDVVGNKLFLPLDISIFAGMLFSDLHGDINENENFGYTAGLQTQLSEKVSLGVSVVELDGTAVTAGVDCRF